LSEFLFHGGFFALLQVIFIDIVLAGDNALVIGMAASHVKVSDRHRVIFWGLAIAVVLRITLAAAAMELLKYPPVMLLGGALLLWVCYRLFNDIRHDAHKQAEDAALPDEADDTYKGMSHAKAMRRAVLSIAIADVSMSLDNVLAVAGAAREHFEVLIIGLLFSIALMGLAANFIAKLLARYPWVSYAGVLIVLYVALVMLWHGVEKLSAAGWISLQWAEPALQLIGA